MRPALPGDARAIAQVQVDAWMQRMAQWVPSWFLERFDPEKQAAKYRERISDPTMIILVVEDEGKNIVGVIGSKPNTEEPLDCEQKIFGLYVSPDCEGRGVGTLLLRTLLSALRERGVLGMVVFTFADNRPARQLYEALGGQLTPFTDSPNPDLKISHVSYRFSC